MVNPDLNTLFTTLRKKRVQFELDDHQNLDIQAPKGSLTPAILQYIKQNKKAIVQHILQKNVEQDFHQIPKAAKATSYPLSAAQLQLWLAIKLFEDTQLYNFHMTFHIEQDLDMDVFKRAVLAVVKRHEILHTVFRESETEGVRQYVVPEIYEQFVVPTYDFSKHDDPGRAAGELIEADIPQPFDLENGPMIRALLFKVGPSHHIVYYSLHHLVSDGWSLNILSADVMAYYQAFLNDLPPNLPTMDIQFADYASWETEMERSGRFKMHEAYWMEQLSGERTYLDLPIAQHRPKERTTKGGSLKTGIKSTVISQLKTFVESENGSLYMGLLTVLKMLFYRYTNESKITFGMAISGRELPELQNQIGLYLNTLPLTSSIDPKDTFLTLFNKVRKACLNVYTYQTYPLNNILNKIEFQREKSRSPFFDFAIVMQNFNENATDKDMLYFTEEIEDFGEDSLQYDMLFDFQEFGDFLDFRLRFNADLYDKTSVKQLMYHFRNLLAVALENPNKLISSLAFLTKEEEQQLLIEFNDTQKEYPQDASVLKLFQQQVNCNGDALAVAHNERKYSYQNLDEHSNQLARQLSNLGVQRGDLIPLCMNRSTDLVVAILAIVKLGAAYIPIDPTYPEERIDYVIADSNCRLFLTDIEHQNVVQKNKSITYHVVNESDWSKELLKTPLNIEMESDDLLYIIYTSGSTGRPKGVKVAHASMINLSYWFAERYKLTVGSQTTMMAGIGFDASALELWTAILSGACVHLIDDQIKLDREALMTYFVEKQVTNSTIPPVLLAEILQGTQPANLALRSILIGGDRLPGIDTSKLSYQVVNGYGPTEATVMVSDYFIKDSDGAHNPPPIGKPMANTQLYVLNESMQLQAIGIPGELYIGGMPLAKGYLNNPTLTAQSFVPNPFSDRVGDLIYRTGDVVKWRPDGDLEFMSRKDKQVKIRGYRIEIGEVEHVLNQLERVQEARIIVGDDSRGQKRLLAYVVGKSDLEPAQLRQQMALQLPDYMLPALFIPIDRFPMTSNGKIDTTLLPAPETAELSKAICILPNNETEVQILNIWKTILRRETISTEAEFFLLGGNSIQIMQLVNQFRETFKVKVSIQELFKNTKIIDQARLIQSLQNIITDRIEKIPLAKDYSLSFAQQRLWVLCHLPGTSVAYNMIGSFELQGEHSPRLLEKIIWKVISRHEILRTVFQKNDAGEPRQIIIPEDQFNLQLTHHYPEEGKELMFADLLEKTAKKVFDLSTGPLIEINLIHEKEHTCQLMFTMHHIISDGLSIAILEREIRQYFDAFMEGDMTIDLVPLRIQYKDYANWQRQKASKGKWKAAAQFWQKELSGELPVLDLLNDKVRPSIASHNGFRLGTQLKVDCLTTLNEICAKHKCSAFMGILAILKILIYRYSGQQEIIVGTAVAGRSNIDLEGQVGFYLNMLPLRTTLNPQDHLTTLLQKIRTTVLATYEYQDYPFDQIIEGLGLRKDLSRSPLFDISISYQNYQHQDRKNQQQSVTTATTIWEIGTVSSKFDFDFSFVENEDGLWMQVDFNTDVYKKESIRQLIQHFRQILELASKHPKKPILELNFLEDAEQQLLTTFNATAQPYPQKTFVDLFNTQVQQTPKAIALSYEEEQISYQELANRSNQFAHYLEQRFFDKKQLIPVCMNRSNELIVVLIGILKAGHAYVPIDATYPPDRISNILQDINAPICLTEKSLLDQSLSMVKTSCELVEYSAIQLEKMPITPVRFGPQLDDLAYVIYTSGSTGKPKGVAISHRSLGNYLYWTLEQYLNTQVVKMGFFSSLSFDFTITSIFGTLASGGELLIYPTKMELGAILQHYLADVNGMTTIKLTPAHVQLIDDLAIPSTSIQKIILGGEALQAHQVATLLRLNPHMTIYNEYGPTETTVGVSVATIAGAIPDVVTIGRPIANTRIYILDENLAIVPINVKGELFIGGVQLAEGYYGDEERTTQSFIDHPFQPGKRLYKTGDLGKWTADGDIVYLGRKDNQVKIRGQRIELGEIETYLEALATVKQVAVIVINDQHDQQQLVAYVNSHGTMDRDQIRKELAMQLPHYMVPQIYVEVENFPLTNNGKVDRKALPAVDFTGALLDQYLAPQNPLQIKLVQIWEELLGVEKVGVRDNFYELGGHSLKSIQLVNRYAQEFSVAIGMEALFIHTTIVGHADLIVNAPLTKQLQIPKVTDRKDYPVSYAQRRMWILSQIGEGSQAYHMPSALRFQGALEIPNFIKAINAVVERHEILRTVFRQNAAGEIRQEVRSFADSGFEVRWEDLTHRKDQTTALQRQIEREREEVFSLENGPLLRVALFSLGSEEYILSYNMHHIISDAWSMEVLVKDVLDQYGMFQQGIDERLPRLPIQYRDYAHWQQQHLTDTKISAARNYWNEQLSGELPVLELPSQKQRPPEKTFNGAAIQFSYSKALSTQLNEFCTTHSGSLFMGLLTGLSGLLYKYTQQTDFIIGTPITGRRHAHLENQIGVYLNTLALRIQFEEEYRFLDLFQQTRQTALASFKYQDYPFDHLVDHLDIQKDASRNPLFDVMLVVQNTHQNEPQSVAKFASSFGEMTYLPVDQQTSQLDLTLTFIETNGQLAGTAEFNTDIYTADFIEQLIRHLETFLEEGLKESTASIAALNILSSTEQKQILEEFNAPLRKDPVGETFLDLWSRQSETKVNQLAIASEELRMTYQELDAYSNQLAGFLNKELSIHANDLVAIKLERNAWLMVALLGVLKTGATYVPIDPEYPQQRIEFMEKDSQCKVCLDATLMEQFQSQQDQYDLQYVSPKIKPEDLAYVIYTSGSTGQPKGVAISHASLLDYVRTFVNYFQLNENDAVLQQATISFDTSVEEIFPIWSVGGSLHILEDRRDMLRLQALLEERRITVLSTNPVVIDFLKTASIPSSLRILISGGDVLRTTNIEPLLDQGILIYNTYGPTESTVCATYYPVTTAEDNLPIGRPIVNREVLIVNAQLQLQPIYVSGEIGIGGKGLAKEYLNQPALSQQKMISHPFVEGERLYMTGDLGRWLPDGNIEFIGRKDNQVKIRGYRIELGEIEQAILQIPMIQQTKVIVDDWEGTKRLLAYFRGNAPIEKRLLRKQLSQSLPLYMLPTYFIQLDTFPVNTNGKIDATKLTLPEDFEIDRGVRQEPVSEEEQALVRVYEAVLQREKIGVNQGFYELGGDSIKAIQVVNQLKQKGYQIKISEILQNPVIEDLAAFLQRTEVKDGNQAAVSGPVVLTPIQHWFFAEDATPKHHFNQSVLLESKEAIDIVLLEKAIQQLTDHHDGLRMVFEYHNGEWTQRNQKQEEGIVEILHYDLRAEEPSKSKLRTIFDEAQQSFDLAKGPLFKAVLVQMKNENKLLLISHHLIVDGISWRIILEDLSNIYQQLNKQIPIRLPNKTTAFQTWSTRLDAYANGPELLNELPYWGEILEKANNTRPLISSMDNGEKPIVDQTTIGFQLTPEETKSLVTNSHQMYGVEMNDVLLAGLVSSLGHVFERNEVLIDLEHHGRLELFEDLSVARTIGWFTSICPIFFSELLQKSSVELLLFVHELLSEIPDQGIVYGLLRYNAKSGAASLPAVRSADVTFNYLGDFGGNSAGENGASVFEFSNEYRGEELSPSYRASQGLLCTCLISGGSLEVSFSYPTLPSITDKMNEVLDKFRLFLQKIISQISQKNTNQNLSTEFFKQSIPISYSQAEFTNKEKAVHATGSFDLQLTDFDQEQFLKAYHQLIETIDLLRVQFLNKDRQMYQSVLPFDALSPKVVCIENEALNYQSIEVQKAFETMQYEPFDLEKGETIRCGIVHNSSTALVLVIVHHLVADDRTIALLQNHLLQLYEGQNTVVPLTNAYFDYLIEQEKYLNSLEAQDKLDFWMTSLKKTIGKTRQPIALEAVQPPNIVVTNGWIDETQTKAIRAYCRNNHILTSSFALSVCVLLEYLNKHSRKQVIQMLGSGRDTSISEMDLSQVVGQFINRLPLALDLDETSTFQATIQQIQEHYLACRDNEQIPATQIEQLFEQTHGYPLKELTDQELNFFNRKNIHFEQTAQQQGNGDRKGNYSPHANLFVYCYEYENVFVFQFNHRLVDDLEHRLFSSENCSPVLQNLIEQILQNPNDRIETLLQYDVLEL